MTNIYNDDDDDLDWNISPQRLKELNEKFKGENFPLFMDDVPEDVSSNPDLEALQKLVYDGETPESIAAHFRKSGNQYLEDGKHRYKDAIISYSKGIEQNCSDSHLNSILHSNRGHIRLMMGGFVECVNDSRQAVKHDRTNAKAYYRGAKASYYMRLFQQAAKFCRLGLQHVPKNAELVRLQKQCEEQLQNQMEKKRSIEQSLKTKQAENSAADKLRLCLKKRGITLKPAKYEMATNVEASVRIGEDGEIHWPALILYDETMVSEFILDVSDYHCIADHLEIMFPGDRFTEWDVEKKYVWNKLCVYLEPGIVDDIKFKVPLDKLIKDVINSVRIISGVLVFHVMVEGSKPHNSFVESAAIQLLP